MRNTLEVRRSLIMAKWQRWKNIMKCYPFEEKRLAKWEPPYIIQPKYDGVRCRAIPLESGDYILLSSEENVIYSVPHINEELKSLSVTHWEYDGELYTHGMSFEQITSITSRTVNIHSDYKEMNFHIFDIVTDKPQHTRLSLLIGMKNEFKKYLHLQLSKYWICDNLEEIMRVYDKLISMDYEGIIVRHCQAPYERKRSLWVMKFKPKKEDNYIIKGYKEEMSISGSPKGCLGTLICESGDGNEFSIGTGFTDEVRYALWMQKESLLGSTARIQYQHLTSGKKVPRFPVFMEVIDG